MIGLAENWGGARSEQADFTNPKLGEAWPEDKTLPVGELRVIVHRLQLGQLRCAVLSTDSGRLMGIAAERLSPELSAWIKRSEFEAPMTACATIEAALRCGFVFVRYDFAQTATRDGRFLIRLKARLEEILKTETEGNEKK